MQELRKRLSEYKVSPIREFGEFNAIDAGFDACDAVQDVRTIVSGEKHVYAASPGCQMMLPGK